MVIGAALLIQTKNPLKKLQPKIVDENIRVIKIRQK